MRARDENKEQAIRVKAVEMIVKEGLEGFGMNKLAKAAGIAPGTIYIYFKDKEDLLLQLGTEIGANILSSSLKEFHPDMPFAEGLKLQWKNRYQYFRKHPLEVQFIEQVRYSPFYDQVTQTLTQNYGDALGKFLQGAIKRKELVKLPFELYWSLAFAPLYQLIKFHAQNGRKGFKLSDAEFDQALNIVIKGLTP